MLAVPEPRPPDFPSRISGLMKVSFWRVRPSEWHVVETSAMTHGCQVVLHAASHGSRVLGPSVVFVQMINLGEP